MIETSKAETALFAIAAGNSPGLTLPAFGFKSDAEFADALLKEMEGYRAALEGTEGWKLVPVEATPEMIRAICVAHAGGVWPDDYGKTARSARLAQARDAWRQAISNAPRTK